MMSVGKIHHFGEGCACPVGNLFRLLFSCLCFEQQDLVIVDTAAGVEHFGRSLDGLCDHVLCVVDPSFESIMMAKRVEAFAMEASGSSTFVTLRAWGIGTLARSAAGWRISVVSFRRMRGNHEPVLASRQFALEPGFGVFCLKRIMFSGMTKSWTVWGKQL